MHDQYNRKIDYLRISLTDRCNLHCRYCQPEVSEHVTHNEILRYEELLRICRAALQLGIRKFKITGGERRVKLLREAMNTKSVTYNWHPSPTSFMEAVISCGDRRLGKVIETAWRKGETLSAWEDYFDLNRWMEAFEECGLDPHFYANRRRSEDEILPWSMISCGVAPGYLKREHALSYEGVTTPDCRTHCNACGANCLVGGKCDV